jgi:hypothetical protein
MEEKLCKIKKIRVKDLSTSVHSRKKSLALNSNFTISIAKQLASVKRSNIIIAASVLSSLSGPVMVIVKTVNIT